MLVESGNIEPCVWNQPETTNSGSGSENYYAVLWTTNVGDE